MLNMIMEIFMKLKLSCFKQESEKLDLFLLKNFDEFALYQLDVDGFERVVYFASIELNVFGIIAIHNTIRGPALGGCRLSDYPTFEDGLLDALNLAQAMTYKNAIVDLPYGGGKSVIFKMPNSDKIAVFRVFYQVLNFLEGTYLTADDVGTCVQDMDYLRQFTPYARGVQYGDNQIPATSYGVYQAIKAAYFYKTKKENLKDVHVIVQGLGKTGYALCRYLHQEGCFLYVDDLQLELVEKAIEEFDAKYVDIKLEKELVADIFCPCALGGSVNRSLLSRLNVHYIIGSANNQLENALLAEFLHNQKIIYVPDYLCNSGGVIDVFCEGENYSEELVLTQTSTIYDKTINILQESESLDESPLRVANRYVEKNLFSKGKEDDKLICR